MSHQKQLIFRSKVDVWLMIVLLFSVVIGTFTALKMIIDHFSIFNLGMGIIIFVIAAYLPLWLFARTYYKIDEQHSHLYIQSGPFRWFIPFAEIHAIDESRNLIASPALSMERLKISYSNNQSILVSPKEKGKFRKTLEALINEYE
ncbi:PH domain-containing protein [Parashewanella tropica]|uniref:PH domain-containing protein n=1 Tax=Parashewanella tropica TaxID=2547970 RepID=UPI00105995E2|nr:PH domain-containing protein [Parashewanella tropica]